MQRTSKIRKLKRKFNKLKNFLIKLNRIYKINNFYSFLKKTTYKGAVLLALFVALLFIVNYFFIDINLLINNFVDTYSTKSIMLFFLISESFLGLIPPEIFIAWASKSTHPSFYLFVLATISYLGGIISYFFGGRLYLIPFVKEYVENKINHHIINLRKWGGLFVVLGALSPIPHSMVGLASGLIKYSFKNYLLWSLFRYVRFIVYAIVIFQIF